MKTEEEFPTFTDCESDTSSICSVNFSDCTETGSVNSLSGIDFSDCSDTGSERFSTSSEHDCSLLSNSLRHVLLQVRGTTYLVRKYITVLYACSTSSRGIYLFTNICSRISPQAIEM